MVVKYIISQSQDNKRLTWFFTDFFCATQIIQLYTETCAKYAIQMLWSLRIFFFLKFAKTYKNSAGFSSSAFESPNFVMMLGNFKQLLETPDFYMALRHRLKHNF